ncbi:hypothetical protein ILYODFUR_024344 [Ilyodon furcidens]|uniref:Uncharacterized protein n=1 Tax=Ilyodon furcidens TaxID=33524 RepID=A0ABV0V7N4_9TELE
MAGNRKAPHHPHPLCNLSALRSHLHLRSSLTITHLPYLLNHHMVLFPGFLSFPLVFIFCTYQVTGLYSFMRNYLPPGETLLQTVLLLHCH